jgi:hypothetical protein
VSLRDRIIAVDDLQREIVKIEQWGIEVEVRGMSGAARAAIVQDAADNNGNVNFAKMMPEVVVTCVFDPRKRANLCLPTPTKTPLCPRMARLWKRSTRSLCDCLVLVLTLLMLREKTPHQHRTAVPLRTSGEVGAHGG